jgi:hypothetical protein
MKPRAILWRRLDGPGHDAACLEHGNPNWHLSGTVVLEDQGRPCRLEYAVVCDSAWQTLWARVSGWIGMTPVSHRISRSPAGQWRMDGVEQPSVQGCIDVDLSFTPATNLLPIRRLGLAVGEAATIQAAWLRFPEFTLTPLDQNYRRESAERYRFESDGGSFTAMLDTDDSGLVVRYGDLWVAEVVQREQ